MFTSHGQGPRTHQHGHGGTSLLGRLLDLDAQVHHALLDEAMDAATGDVEHATVHRVLDVGAGTGSGTFRWANRYPDAEVIALDASPEMTQRIAAQVRGERVTTINRPVSAMGLEPGSVDLTWASSVIHEFDDPAAAFDALSRAIRPGGVLAVMEMDGPPRVLPDEYDRLESHLRLLAHADAPHPDWSSLLRDAGFEPLEKRTLSSDQTLPANGPGGEYTRAELRRLALHAADGLDAEQNAVLSQILRPGTETPSLRGVHVRGTRSLWIARRP